MNFATFGAQLCGEEAPWFLGIFDLSTPPALLYYSYIPIVVATLLISTFVYLHRKSLTSKLLLAMSLLFGLWVLNVLVQWVSSYNVVLMFAWQLTALIEVALYLTVAYLAYAFYFRRDLPAAWKWVFVLILMAVAAATPTALNVSSYDLYNCEGMNGILWSVIYALEPAIIVLTVALGIGAWKQEQDALYRKQILFMAGGLALFLGVFFLSNYYGELTKLYEFNLWGPVGMFFFVMFLGYMIVEFKAFNVKLLGAQALVYATVILIASQYFFIEGRVSHGLVTATLLLTAIFGYALVRSVKREVAQREHIEQLAKELEKSNSQQVVLIHFITHQIKGFVTKSRNIFSMLLEGDFGVVPESMKPMIEEGLRSDTKGANTIQEILNAANIKSGKVTYARSPVDMRELTGSIISDLKPAADTKGLALTLVPEGEDFTIQADRMQLTNALKNLIDNSIKYTPKGSVTVTLTREPQLVRLTVTDTGVGITPEDMHHLFTEGGHGKESQKVNVESTGFGLYIVKNIIEAHHGKVWAESEGAGKGSRFITELPVS
ncbi:MAG TPA: ATP-binding protein [Candidatus Paceibacterota bacterium]|jgi:signal transduction histidine kinase